MCLPSIDSFLQMVQIRYEPKAKHRGDIYMAKRHSFVLLGIAIPVLSGLFTAQTDSNCLTIVRTAEAKHASAVFNYDAEQLFAVTPEASKGAIDAILLLKANGEFATVSEIYSELVQAGRPPGNPLDQGGETFALATQILAIPYNDVGSTGAALHNYDTNFGGCPASTARDVVYRYQPLLPQQVVVELCGSGYDTKLMVFQDSPATPVACNDDACGLSSRVSVLMNPGNTYYIVVDGFDVNSFGPYTIFVHEDTPCDVVIPPHAVRECGFEVQTTNHGMKDCNGGCNNETVPGQYDLDRYDGICAGTPVGGMCFTYLAEGNIQSRDTDWFLFNMLVAGPADVELRAEFDALVGIVNLDDCIAPSFVQSTVTPSCTPGIVNIPHLEIGTYAAFVAPSAFSGIEVPREYLLTMNYPTLPSPCADCPMQEAEPNDDLERATVIPGPSMMLCGDISCPMDGDYYVFQVPFPSALRVHLRGNAAVGSCPAGQGLHPYCEIITEDGREIALAGDITNQATWFDSDFKFGPYRYYLHVGGAGYTTGPYEIEIEMLPLSLVSCNPISVTIQPENNGVRLRWHGGLLPSDIVRIEYRTDANLPFQLLVDVPPVPASFFDPGSEPFDFREYQVRVIGGREPELSVPWVGSNIGLGESAGPDGAYDEVGNFAVQQIEWAIGPDNVAIQTLLVAHGVGGSAGDALVQDRRDLYEQGYQPISSFAGHWLQVDERKVLVEHVAFHRDPVTGDVGVIDGRGMNEGMDTVMFFGNERVFLEPNNGGISGASLSWLWWWWWEDFFCPSFCCRLKSIAFCTSTGAGAPPGCASPPLTRCPCNPSCWLGCPCDPPVPPDPAFCCPPMGPPTPTYATGCSGCTFVPLVGAPFRIIYCQCAAEPTPPASGRCFFMIFVKCKTYCPCPDLFNVCGCAVTPCPGPATWTLVPFVTSAMRAACKSECVLGGPGC